MKVLGIVGSKRKKGNTAHLVNTALSQIEKYNIDTEVIYLDDYNIEDCRGCEGCQKNFKCVIQDDMQKLYPKINEADALVIGSPTYFYNITADMKAFLDRMYTDEIFDDEDRSVWLSLNEVTGLKYAVVVAVCEQNNADDMGFTADSMSMTLQALGYRVVSCVKALHLFKRNEALENETAVNQAKESGDKLAKTLLLKQRTLKKIKQHNS